MADERVVSTLLQYKVDNNSVAAAARSVDTVRDKLEKINDPLSKLGQAASKSIGGLNNQLKQVNTNAAVGEVKALSGAIDALPSDEVDALAKSFDNVADKAEKAKRAAKIPTFADQASNVAAPAANALSKVGSAASALGAGSAVSDIGALVGSVEALKGAQVALTALGLSATGFVVSITPLLPVLLPLAAAAAAVALVISQVSAESAKASKALQAQIDAQTKLNQSIDQGATRDDLLKQFGDLNRQRETLAQQINEQVAEYNSQFSSDLGQRLARLGTTIDDTLIENIDKGKTSLEALDAELDALNRNLNNAELQANSLAKALDSSINAQKSVIDALVGGATTTQINQTIDQLQRRISLEGDLVTSLERQRTSVDAASPAFAVLTDQINASKQSLLDSETQLTAYNTALGSSAVATADAAAAAQALTDQEAKLTAARQTALQDAVNQLTDTARLAREGSSQQVEGRINALNDEKTAIEATVPNIRTLSKLTAEQAALYKPLIDRYAQLTPEIQRLQQVLQQDIIPREAIKSNLEAVKKVGEAIQGRLAAQRKVDDARKGVDEAVLQRQQNLARIQQELTESEGKLQQDAQQQVLDNVASAQKAREKQEQEHQENLKRINQRANAGLANAIRTRDVVAAITAQETRQQELSDERESKAKQSKAIDDALKEQNATVEKRLREQLATTRAAAQRQLQVEAERSQKEISLRQQALSQTLRDLGIAQLNERMQLARHYDAVSQTIRSGLQAAAQTASSFVSSVLSSFSRLGNTASARPTVRTNTGGSYTPALPAANSRTNNITVNAANSSRQISNISNQQARIVLRQVMED